MYIGREDIIKGIPEKHLQAIEVAEGPMENSIEEAVSEVRAYLAARYDMDAEMRKTGSNRSSIIVKIVRDITIYNLYNNKSSNLVPDSRKDAYTFAISFLKNVQAEKASIESLTRITSERTGGSPYISFGSNPKRKNHY